MYATTSIRRIAGTWLLLCMLCAFQLLQLEAFSLGPTSVVRTGICQTTMTERRHNDYSYSSGRSVLFAQDDDNDDDDNDNGTSDINKFDMAQRIESLKSVVLGALSGGIAVTPIAYLHYVYFASNESIAQWEFVTDMSSLQAALFAIVYRYAVRQNDDNPMLNQGVVGAFVIVRTLSNIQVTDTCRSIPLRCKSCSSISTCSTIVA